MEKEEEEGDEVDDDGTWLGRGPLRVEWPKGGMEGRGGWEGCVGWL